jgi:CHAD domain-containing protein
MKARKVEGLDPGGGLGANVASIVEVRLDELGAFSDEALAPDAGKAQHDLRIAVKRLRYVLEIFAPCLGEEAKDAGRVAKGLQSALGDLHDCDLMLPKVEHIDSVSTSLQRRRERLFHEFVEQWQASEHVWLALERRL